VHASYVAIMRLFYDDPFFQCRSAVEVAGSKPTTAPKRKPQSQPSSSQGEGKRQRVKPASGSKKDDAINVASDADEAPPDGTQPSKAADKTAKGPNPPVLKNLEVKRKVVFSTPDSGVKAGGGSSKPLVQSRLSTSASGHPVSSPVTLPALDPEWRSQFPSDVYDIPGPEDSTGETKLHRMPVIKDYGHAYGAEVQRLIAASVEPPVPSPDFILAEDAKVLAVWNTGLKQIMGNLASERKAKAAAEAKAKAAAEDKAKAAAAAEALAKAAAEDKAKAAAAAEAKTAAPKPAAAPKPTAAASQKAKHGVVGAVDPLPPPPIPQLYHTGGGDEVLKMFAGFQDQIQWQSEVLDRYSKRLMLAGSMAGVLRCIVDYYKKIEPLHKRANTTLNREDLTMAHTASLGLFALLDTIMLVRLNYLICSHVLFVYRSYIS
jgi:hypothetical protein